MEKQANHESNLKAIREKLLHGRRITVQSILKSVGTQELRHYISVLRKDPTIKIETEWASSNGKRYKEYFVKKQIAA